MKEIRRQLMALAEPEYQKFAASLLPGTDKILGVRLPALRKLARQIAKQQSAECAVTKELEGRLPDWRSFEKMQPEYFEEIMLQGFVLGYVKVSDEEACGELLSYIAAFVPKIANWSVCDSFCCSLKFVKNYPERIWDFLMPYLQSEKEYELRFGIVMLLFYYVSDKYIEEVLDILKTVRHEGYYVKMAVAWALSMCYVRYPKETEGLLTSGKLDDFTHNKTIQKICESRQVSPEVKKNIRELKREL